MKIIGHDRFSARLTERIDILITKSVAPYSAQPSEMIGTVWAPKPDNNGGLMAQGGFTMPNNPASFAVLYNFPPGATPDSSGDFYTVSLTGSNGGVFNDIVFGPGSSTRTYFFQVEP